jgi:hypothetical protein
MAIMKAATAATDSPAICAGVIFGRPSFATGAAIEVGVDEVVDVADVADVADAGSDIESTKTDWLEDNCVCNVFLVLDVIVAIVTGVVDDVEDREVVLGTLLATMVRAVLVGKTAFFWPRHTLYADAARSMLLQEAYTQPRATSPNDSPLKL